MARRVGTDAEALLSDPWWGLWQGLGRNYHSSYSSRRADSLISMSLLPPSSVSLPQHLGRVHREVSLEEHT